MEEYLTYEDFEKMYRDEHGNIPEFYYIVKKNLGILENPKADKLMAIAWEDGHSGGYYEVYQKARDLVELIEPCDKMHLPGDKGCLCDCCCVPECPRSLKH